MLEVRKDVELGNLIETLYTFVLSFGADAIAFQHTNVQVTAHDQSLEVFQRHCDGARSDKRFIDKVSGCDLGLVRHQKRKFMVS